MVIETIKLHKDFNPNAPQYLAVKQVRVCACVGGVLTLMCVVLWCAVPQPTR